MTAKTGIKPLDFERVENLLKKNVAMLEIMHSALEQIANCEDSLDAGIPMRAVAVAALIDVNHIQKKEKI